MNAKEIVDCSDIYPTMSVSDLSKTIKYYQNQLGFELEFIWGAPPQHAGVRLGKATLHFNEATQEVDYDGNFWLYFVVDDVDAYYEFLKSQGVELMDAPTDREWGMREINVRDINGLVIRFGQACLNYGDPVKVERIEMNARIEKRLANVIKDLADHKGMTVGQMLEETLLHSFEPLPDSQGEGVASPHTARTMDFIEQLKRQHGVDYKTHDAYRFID